MIKAVLLDFWGTLVENGVYPSPVRQVRYLLRIQEPFSEFIPKFEESFMLKKHENLTVAFDDVCKAFNVNPPQFVKDKLVGMWNKNTILAKPFPETIEALEKLKKYKLALICNTDPFSVEAVLDKFDLRKYFNSIILSYEVGCLKTDKKLYETALKKLKVKKDEAIMVGDSMETDIKGAENAGISPILIDRHGKREYKDKISNLNELDNFLK